MSNRIRTTHVGSLPRPAGLLKLLVAREKDEPVGEDVLAAEIARAVEDVVARQRRIGIDIINDGEMSKISYATYVSYRFGGITPSLVSRRRPSTEDDARFPDFSKRLDELLARVFFREYECTGPLVLKDAKPLQIDLANFRAAADKHGATERFMTAASPGIVAGYILNRHFATNEDYLNALVDLLRPEYEAIVDAGFTLQLDCPDLSTPDVAERTLAVEAINAATKNIDPQRMRMHLCWGNAEAPHDRDTPLLEILPTVVRARPGTIVFEAANPRHEHEWAIFEDFPFPDDKSIVPGVIDSTTNFIEHPELVAQRIGRFVRMFGADRVTAGVDCGFGTHALLDTVDPEIAFAKLQALVDGAAIAGLKTHAIGA